MNPDMRYRVASIKNGDDRESVLVYAADREEALQHVTGLFSSAPVVIGEIEGKFCFVDSPTLCAHFGRRF